jgi:hypothetical protein
MNPLDPVDGPDKHACLMDNIYASNFDGRFYRLSETGEAHAVA